ncbi:hypothetical protein CEV31_2421 [Brucella thiophenivorans]|uniref:Uncharacterized protein n=1 Tax=Brucella thiophenivorans TaxID=571255 RepID=A0A256FW34_9HYPH|nr:hypothetical protein CEV31_2421 [Brucella thiophenivorans]
MNIANGDGISDINGNAYEIFLTLLMFWWQRAAILTKISAFVRVEIT